MKKTTKIIAALSAVALSIAILVAGSWASHQPSKQQCAWLEIEIVDSTQRCFVDVKELQNLIYRNGLSPVGKEMDQVSCQAIEACVSKHSMVRRAECYKLHNGGMRIRVEQRIPKLQVISTDGHYWVDEERQIMPYRPQTEVDVPIFKGNVSHSAATTEFYDFACWLSTNRYWKPRIKGVEVKHPKYVVLTQHEVDTRIVLGDLNAFEDKMKKLQKLYTKGFERLGHTPNYKEYDLRFDKQVIGRY